MLDIFLYFIAFIIGTLLGSFCTLAVYRIPLKKNITYERSFCVNCSHKLDFFDLIPILSYIFLRGKCRYCGKKIRIRYLILEIFFGLTYMLFIMSLNLDIFNITVDKIIYIFFITLYLITLVLIAGIDKEHIKIEKSVLNFEICSSIIYIVYLYIIGVSIYRYVIYLSILLILIILNYVIKKRQNKSNYMVGILMLCMIMLIFTSKYVFFETVLLVSLSLLIIKFFKNKKINNVPIVFYICIYNIMFLIINNFLVF